LFLLLLLHALRLLWSEGGLLVPIYLIGLVRSLDGQPCEFVRQEKLVILAGWSASANKRLALSRRLCPASLLGLSALR